ncbi:MAG: alpha/beta fold hydrolase, partial [Ardenticatenia bacterium]
MTTLYFIEEGEGPALLLLHSGGMSSEEWRRHIPAFAKHFRVIAPDLPGHGRSPLPENEPLSIGAMARAVRTLLDDLGIAEAHVLGSSMGGAVALRLTLDAPERVSRLILYRVHYTKDPALYRHTLDIANPERWRQVGLDKWLSQIHTPQG